MNLNLIFQIHSFPRGTRIYPFRTDKNHLAPGLRGKLLNFFTEQVLGPFDESAL